MTDEPQVTRSRVLSPQQFSMLMATSGELKAHKNDANHPALVRAVQLGGYKREGGHIARTAAAGVNWATAVKYHTMS